MLNQLECLVGGLRFFTYYWETIVGCKLVGGEGWVRARWGLVVVGVKKWSEKKIEEDIDKDSKKRRRTVKKFVFLFFLRKKVFSF